MWMTFALVVVGLVVWPVLLVAALFFVFAAFSRDYLCPRCRSTHPMRLSNAEYERWRRK